MEHIIGTAANAPIDVDMNNFAQKLSKVHATTGYRAVLGVMVWAMQTARPGA